VIGLCPRHGLKICLQEVSWRILFSRAEQETSTKLKCLRERFFALCDSYFSQSLVTSTPTSPHVSILASGVKHFLRYFFRVPVQKLNDIISSQVACLLKEEREKRGLSLNVLAQKAGLSRQTVSYVEQEVQNLTLDTLLRITSVLEVDLEKIIAKARKAAVKQKP